MVLAAVLSMLRYVGEIEERDFVDRLHSYTTANILIGLSVLVSFKQFGGKPVECLVPDLFTSSWEQYAENYCWAQDTYYVPMKVSVESVASEQRREQRISYYQWVPFFLLFEAACFRFPSVLWKYMAAHSGIKIHEIIKLSSDPNNIKPEIKMANIRALSLHLQGALRFHRLLNSRQIKPHKFLRFFNLPYSARFVTVMYLIIKFLYLLNVALQLIALNRFLATSTYEWYGLGALMDLLSGRTWEQSGLFPRISLCDFQVRVMGQVQSHTIQCVLVINIFNERIFVFLWFWYLMLVVFSLGSFLYWILIMLVMPKLNRRFISRHLEMSNISFDPDASKENVKKFIKSYLQSDGVLVLRMLTFQSGVIFGTELVASLWEAHFGGTITIVKRSASLTKIEFGDESDAKTNPQEKFWSPPGHSTGVVFSPPIASAEQSQEEIDALNQNTINRLKVRDYGRAKEVGPSALERFLPPSLAPISSRAGPLRAAIISAALEDNPNRSLGNLSPSANAGILYQPPVPNPSPRKSLLLQAAVQQQRRQEYDDGQNK